MTVNKLKMSLLAGVLFACCCLTGFSQTNSFFQFVQEQNGRHYTQVKHEVLAVWYGWYGLTGDRNPWGNANMNRHELSRIARFPLKGPYSSHDTDVMDWQIEKAKASGITGFLVSWWGLGAWDKWCDESLALLLNRAEAKDFKVGLYWERAPGEGQPQIDLAVHEISEALKRYGRSRAFLKVDDRPVVFSYGRVLGQVPVASWPDIINGIRARAGDFALLADGYQPSYACLFDGVQSYDIHGLPVELEKKMTFGKVGDLHKWAAQWYENGVRVARQRDRISCIMVSPGIDTRKAYKSDWAMNRLDGQTYRSFWEEAIKARPDWITITSWNEWPEGTEIEPSLELGDTYLKITAEYARRFLASDPIPAPPVAALPQSIPGTTQSVATILSGRKVGVLVEDPMNDAEFWAAYCGASLRRLEWKDLIAPKIFNTSNAPILLHIGAESYVSSVKVSDDVTRSLIRYLHEGGMLVSMPTGPWPLYYDLSRKGQPYPITNKLGMGVDSEYGFEQPPAGWKLTFRANTNALHGLNWAAPFPSEGDLRWRHASRQRVAASDIYIPLVDLLDAGGRSHGQGAVCVEHRTLPLAPGKTIYVWMHTPEAFGSENFFPSLYQFISTRLKPLPADDNP